MRPLQSASSFSLRCTVFLLNADPSLLAWHCTSLSAGLPRWRLLTLLPLSCFKHVWHRFLGCLSLLCGASHTLFLLLSSSSVSARGLQHLPSDCAVAARGQHHCTWRLSCCLLEVGRWHVLALLRVNYGSSVPVFASQRACQQPYPRAGPVESPRFV